MKLLAPVLYTLAFGVILYGTKLVWSKEHYDFALQVINRYNAIQEQIKKQTKARVDVVEQFQQQSAYGPDLGRMAAASQYTLIKT